MSASVVDEIREQLERPEVSVESMERLAESYSQEVEKVNQRLAICSKLLERGRRSDAVQQAAMRPTLLEWCSRLDFPELEEWLEILQFIQAKVPTPVNLEAVGQLREALVDDQPIEELLLQQRRLAIGKAPIAWRLNVLRRLSVIDSGNAIWREDVETFEKARMREIQSEFNNAAKANNYDTCRALVNELTHKSWQSAPPNELLKQVCATTDRLQREVQCNELRTIASAMYSAFCAQEDAKCRAQRTRWQALLSELKDPPPREIVESAEPALVWLAELDKARAAKENHLRDVAQLVAETRKCESIRAIQTAYENANSHGIELDSQLEIDSLAAISKLRIRSKRRTVIYAVGVLAATVFAIVGISFWHTRRMHKQDTVLAVEALQQFLRDGKLQEANKYLEELKTSKAKVAASMEIKPLVSDLEGRLNADRDRRDSFEKYISASDQSAPEEIDLVALGNAEKLAVTPDEKERAKAIRIRREEFENSVADREFQALKSESADLEKNIEVWESTVASKLHEGELALALNKIGDLRKKYTKGQTSSLLDELESRTNAIQVMILNTRKAIENESAALARIRSATTLESLATALGNFPQQSPQSLLASKFAIVSKEAAIWQRTLEWNDLASSVDSYLKTKNTGQLPSLREKLSKIEASFSDTSKLASLKQVQEILNKILQRDRILSELKDNLKEDPRSTIVMITGFPFENANQQTRFFASPKHIEEKKATLKKKGTKTLEVVNALDGNTGGQTFKDEVLNYQHPKKEFDELFKWFDDNREKVLVEWEKAILHYANKICGSPLDHKIKEFLVLTLLKSGVEGSMYLEEVDKKYSLIARLERREQSSWFEGSQPQIKLDDEVIQTVCIPLRETYDQLTPDNINRPLEQLARCKLNFIGIVELDEKNVPRPTLNSNVQIRNGRIFVLIPSRNDVSVAQPVLIGSAQEGKVIFDGDKNELITGRPLFHNLSVGK